MDFSKLGQAAAATDDLTVERKFKRELPREGITMLRLKDYIELGRHEAKNPQHKPALKCLLVFELSHPDHLIEIDGKQVPQKFTLRVNKSYSDKGKYMPLFKVMNRACNNKFNNFVQMVGQPFLGRIYHNVYEGVTYANLDDNGAWSLAPPYQEDALSGAKTAVPIPELSGTPSACLWEPDNGISDEMVQGMWDSIYIAGTRSDDKGNEVSKNWIQETIMKNLEWEGSRIQGVTQEHVGLDDDEEPTMPALDGLPTL